MTEPAIRDRPPTRVIFEVAGVILHRLCTVGPSRVWDLVRAAGCSHATLTRAIRWLREHDVPIHYDHATRLWAVGQLESMADWTLADAARAGAITVAQAQALACLTAACTLRVVTRP